MTRPAWTVLAALALLISGAALAQGVDVLFSRVKQLVDVGNRPAAKALADSAMLVRTPGTAAYAEALYARGYAASDAAAAERDYLRLSLEYPFSPRVEDAVSMLAQFRWSRGDRAGARAQYERLARDFPQSEQAARANYWAGRLALEDGDLAAACPHLFVASERAPRTDVELRNQVEYLRNRCMMPAAATPVVPPDSARSDSVTTPPTASGRSATPVGEYSVQVAAYARKRDADALSARLKTRGFQVRVVGTRAPFRVRVGRYATRAEAVAAQGRMKRAGVSGLVVEAEPR